MMKYAFAGGHYFHYYAFTNVPLIMLRVREWFRDDLRCDDERPKSAVLHALNIGVFASASAMYWLLDATTGAPNARHDYIVSGRILFQPPLAIRYY